MIIKAQEIFFLIWHKHVYSPESSTLMQVVKQCLTPKTFLFSSDQKQFLPIAIIFYILSCSFQKDEVQVGNG